MGARLYTNKEWRFLSWWLATFHANAEIWMNLRIGPTLPIVGKFPQTDAEQAISRVRNRWADAVFLENGELTLVEAKLEPEPGIFSTLIHYARKLRMDPNFSQYAQARLNLVALVMRDDPTVSIEAPWYGIQWVNWIPPYVSQQGMPILPGWLGEVPSELPHDFVARVSLLTGKA